MASYSRFVRMHYLFIQSGYYFSLRHPLLPPQSQLGVVCVTEALEVDYEFTVHTRYSCCTISTSIYRTIYKYCTLYSHTRHTQFTRNSHTIHTRAAVPGLLHFLRRGLEVGHAAGAA